MNDGDDEEAVNGGAESEEEIFDLEKETAERNQSLVKTKKTLTDNKRGKLEKPLSALQRDQVMLRVAKEELETKKENAATLKESSKSMEKSMEMMAQAINSLGQQVGNGLMMIAQSLSANNLPMAHTHVYPRYEHQQRQQFPANTSRERSFGSMMNETNANESFSKIKNN